MSELPSHRLKQAKRALRREVLAARDALQAEYRARGSRAITANLLALPELTGARTVMVFWSFGSEVDTGPLVASMVGGGHITAMPRVEGPDVVPVEYMPGDAVAQTAFGAFEPVGGRELDPAELDLVIVPGVAFDAAGRRVGYGGGFYDRLLPRLSDGVPAIALAFAIQVVPLVPEGGTDRRVDAVVTEEGVLRCG